MRLVLGFLFMAFLFHSCGGGGGQAGDRFSWVDVGNFRDSVPEMKMSSARPVVVKIRDINQDLLPMREFADTVRIIPLESTGDGSMIGSVDKVVIDGNRIYILDKWKRSSVFIFTEEGKFLTSVGTRGQGPGEYTEPTDFDVVGDSVVVLDQFKTELLFYTSDGKYMSSRKMPFYATGLSVMNDTTYLFNSIDADNVHLGKDINYNLLMTDSTMTIIRKGFPVERDKYTSVWIPENFYRSGNQTYYHPAFADRIYGIDCEGEITPCYQIDFGGKSLPEKYLLSENWNDFKKESVQSAYYIFSGESYVTDNWLFIEFLDKHETRYAFYDKRTGGVKTGKYLKNDLGIGLPLGNIVGGCGNTLVTSITPDILVQSLKHIPEDKKADVFTPEAIRFISTLKDEDNPILLLFSMK